jgi:pimeloyl-ACP methyl ester carboxylesterase
VRWRWPVAAAIGVGAAAAGAGVALVRANRRWQSDPTSPEALDRTLPADVVDHMVTVGDGGKIHVVERGQGPPVVLVHGVTLGVAVWAPQLRRLADQGHRVIAVGQRGHGRSSAGEGGYSLERLADDLGEVLEALDVTGAVLVGHSMGGMVAQLLALRQPDEFGRHVAGLVLLATSAGPLITGPGAARVAGALAGGADLGLRRAERGGRGLIPHDGLGPLISRLSFGADPAPCDIELTRSMIAAMSPTAMSGLLPGLLAFDVSRRIGAIDLPTWVVVGSRDTLTPPRMARAMAAAIPRARLVVLPGCGHMVMLEREDELDQLLVRASSEVAPAPS